MQYMRKSFIMRDMTCPSSEPVARLLSSYVSLESGRNQPTLKSGRLDRPLKTPRRISPNWHNPLACTGLRFLGSTEFYTVEVSRNYGKTDIKNRLIKQVL